jgi:hypothetical protein
MISEEHIVTGRKAVLHVTHLPRVEKKSTTRMTFPVLWEAPVRVIGPRAEARTKRFCIRNLPGADAGAGGSTAPHGDQIRCTGHSKSSRGGRPNPVAPGSRGRCAPARHAPLGARHRSNKMAGMPRSSRRCCRCRSGPAPGTLRAAATLRCTGGPRRRRVGRTSRRWTEDDFGRGGGEQQDPWGAGLSGGSGRIPVLDSTSVPPPPARDVVRRTTGRRPCV